LCNKILDTDAWPEDWRRSVFVTIPKVTGTMKCEEHRTIAYYRTDQPCQQDTPKNIAESDAEDSE